MKELFNLLHRREKALDVEMTDEQWAKLRGVDPGAGNKCVIVWKDLGDEYPDYGYLFDLPIGNDGDSADIFIHIPHPQNPSGIDTPPPVFLHLHELLQNELVVNVCLNPTN